MENTMENTVKLILVVVLLVAGLCYWLLPKTRFARHLKMNEGVFVVSNVIGMICGALGLAVTILWPRYIIELHLWEFIIMPLVLVYAYWGVVMRTGKTLAIFDEKQNVNLTGAAAISWVASIPAMAILFVLYYQGILDGNLWFPYYMFMTLLVFSAGALYYFKRA